MAKTKKRQAFAEERVFSAQEFEASGIRELSFEELLEVNGGRHVIDDPSTDDVSDTIANGGHSPGGSSSSSDSGSSGGSSGGNSFAPPSSSPSEPVTGSDSDDTGGSTCDGWNNYWNGLTSGGSSGGGSSGSTGGSSGNSDSSGDSSSNDSSGDDYSSGDDSDSGYWGSGGSGYTPPAQSQPAPKPNKGEETSPTQGGAAPRGEAVAMMRNQPETIVSSEKPSNAEIKKKADNYNHHRYIKGKQEFRCDNYVEAVIKDCGLDSLKYLAGAATEKNVEQHITNAKEKQFAVKSERYNPQNLQDGTYVVLMNNSDKNFNAHAGIIFQEGGRTEYRDNSSCNTWVDKNGIKFEGGVIQQDYSGLRAFQADYGYNDFYYIKIN